MTQRHRSTTLKYLTKHCAYAMRLAMQDAPFFRDHFEYGVVAHAINQAIVDNRVLPAGYEDIADKVVQHLTTEGRVWDGKPQPPVPIEAAFEGRRVALAYLDRKPIRVGEGVRAEVGLGIDKNGKACGYDSPRVRIVAAIDLVIHDETYDEEDGTVFSTIEVLDYKGAWPTNRGELETLQRKIQALLVYEDCVAKGSVPGVLRITVANLRTAQHYSMDLYPMSDEGAATLEGWKREVMLLADIADKASKASPSLGCIDCPFVLQCDEGRNFLRAYTRSDAPIETIAKAHAYASGVVETSKKVLRVATKDTPIVVDNIEIGYFAKPRRSVPKEGIVKVATSWFGEEPDEKTLGLLNAIGMSPTAVEKIAKIAKDESILDVLEEKTSATFGLRQHVEPAVEDEGGVVAE